MSLPVVRVKDGVQFARIAPGGMRILGALEAAARVVAEDLWITSACDGGHLPTSRHYTGEAYDVRALAPGQTVRVVQVLRQTLGPQFTVFYESPTPSADVALRAVGLVNPHATAPHIHIQVATGVTYPPPVQDVVTTAV